MLLLVTGAAADQLLQLLLNVHKHSAGLSTSSSHPFQTAAAHTQCEIILYE
jgi:hypothetical protein